jgi:hypothetical protein
LSSDDLDVDVAGVRREGFQIRPITCQHRAAWFGERHDDRVDCRPGPGPAPELSGSARNGWTDLGVDDAALQEAVRVGISTGVALERFDDPAITEMRAEYAKRRDLVVAGLRAIGCDVQPPEAGIFVWARCPIDRATGKPMSSWAFVERLIEEVGVVTVPGAGFGASASEYFRVSLTRETHRLAEAMQRLRGMSF